MRYHAAAYQSFGMTFNSFAPTPRASMAGARLQGPAGRLILHRMSTGRSRNAAQTRADILDAARRRFGSDGYQSTTLRAVAADVGIDAALIIRYFGTKQKLFAEAAEFTINLPDRVWSRPAGGGSTNSANWILFFLAAARESNNHP
jgi:AcrR family transcriptional regulator